MNAYRCVDGRIGPAVTTFEGDVKYVPIVLLGALGAMVTAATAAFLVAREWRLVALGFVLMTLLYVGINALVKRLD